MKVLASLLFFCLLHTSLDAQYAPQAGTAGSDAIPHNSSQIAAWATGCTISRGFMDVAQPASGYASSGDSTLAIGNADNTVVSLGDSGMATLTFAAPIINQPGPDFAVFENGFLNASDIEEAFLELAFVEVSSDGVLYFRFPSTSLTQTDQQIAGTGAPGTGDYINARHIHNLAGKYISKNGTPFDLEDMTGITGLDVNHVTHVRILDVTGSLGAHSSADHSGNIINDPYPTPFPTCGFDLDAVAVIHQSSTYAGEVQDIVMSAGPNPTSEDVFIQFRHKGTYLTISDVTGKTFFRKQCGLSERLDVRSFQNGVYFFNFTDAKGNRWAERIVKY